MAFTNAEAWLKDINTPSKPKRNFGGRRPDTSLRFPPIPSGEQLDAAAAALEVKQLQEENSGLKEEMETLRERMEQLQQQLAQ